MPNVLFVDQTGQLGGAELCLREIVLHRQNSGDHVALLAKGPFAERLFADGIDVSVVPFSRRSAGIQKETGLIRKLTSLGDVMRVALQVRSLSRSYDVVYANTAKALVIASIANAFRRKPLVYHLHDILTPEHFSGSNRRLLVTLANRADGVIANSDATKNAFLQAGGRGDHVTVIPNGIDLRRFDEVAAEASQHRDRIRRSLSVNGNSLVGLFGRLAPWKGQHVAIEAIAAMPDTHLALIGDALFGESDYADDLRSTARRMGLQDRVHFLGFRDDVAEIMQACDVVLHASVAAEPFGRVIVEAMVSDRPVVVANAGGAAEIIEDGTTGWLYEPGNVKAMRAAIDRAISEENPAMIRRADAEARRRYDLKLTMEDISRVIETVIRLKVILPELVTSH